MGCYSYLVQDNRYSCQTIHGKLGCLTTHLQNVSLFVSIWDFPKNSGCIVPSTHHAHGLQEKYLDLFKMMIHLIMNKLMDKQPQLSNLAHVDASVFLQ